jgi:hypothetical protein
MSSERCIHCDRVGVECDGSCCNEACSIRYRLAHGEKHWAYTYNGVTCSGTRGTQHECAVWHLRPGATWEGKPAHDHVRKPVTELEKQDARPSTWMNP